MNPPVYFSIGCMTGYELIFGIQNEFTEGSRYGIVHSTEIGCIDAPESIPAGGMRFADNTLGKCQIQSMRPWR